MNLEKLKKLQESVRIGGKGTPRRKKKIVHQTAATDDKKLQSSLKKLSVNTIPGIEEVNMIKDDGTVIHFNNPKAQASLAANTFAITGHAEHKQISEMLPGILTQLGPEGLNQLKRLANNVVAGNKLLSSVAEEDDVPNLVENFDEVVVAPKEVEKKEEAPVAAPASPIVAAAAVADAVPPVVAAVVSEVTKVAAAVETPTVVAVAAEPTPTVAAEVKPSTPAANIVAAPEAVKKPEEGATPKVGPEVTGKKQQNQKNTQKAEGAAKSVQEPNKKDGEAKKTNEKAKEQSAQGKKQDAPKQAPSKPTEAAKPETPKAAAKPEAPKAAAKPEAPKSAAKPETPKAAAKPETPKAAAKPEAPKAAPKPEAPKAAAKPEAPKVAAPATPTPAPANPAPAAAKPAPAAKPAADAKKPQPQQAGKKNDAAKNKKK